VTFDPNTDHAERAEADADVAYRLLAARWGELLQYLALAPLPSGRLRDPVDAATRVPEVRGLVDSWRDFRAKHDDYFTPIGEIEGALSGQRQNLAVAEGNAGSHGYAVSRWSIESDGTVRRADPDAKTGPASPGPTPPRAAAETSASKGPTVVAPPAGPSVEALHPVATAVDAAAPNVPGAPKQSGGPKPPVDGDRYLGVKLGALGALVLGGVAGTLAMKSDAARAGLAAATAVATGLAGAALFWPEKTSKKEKVET
jgi:hypothetical protein